MREVQQAMASVQLFVLIDLEDYLLCLFSKDR